MKKLLAIVAGDPESINSEIIAKTWRKKKIFKKTNIFVIGNYELIKSQLKILHINCKIKKINKLENTNFKNKLLIYDIPLSFKNSFKVKNESKSKYILKSLNLAVKFSQNNKIIGFINCPINKKDIFKKNIGVTEFLGKKLGIYGKEAMLIYNKKISVSPITTHIKIKNISKKISMNLIFNKIITINNFYSKILKIKARIGIIGLNPHNSELRKDSEEIRIIIPAIKKLKKRGINVYGPIPGDTAFLKKKLSNFDVLVGMYHDQVLSPFKALFNFNAINITLGLPFIRISPDHGTGKDIIKKNLGNPSSLIEAIKFFNKINVKT